MAAKCRIGAMIEQKGLKKKYVAEQLGLNESYFSRIASGKVVPNIETLHRIAQFFGCYIDDLYDFDCTE
jgi:putative transcriptional regulator